MQSVEHVEPELSDDSDAVTLTGLRKSRLMTALESAHFDAFLAVSSANLQYATGYRSLGASVHGVPSAAALVSGHRTVVAGPVADSAPALESAIAADDYVPYGTFYFESPQPLPPAYTPGSHDSFADALCTAVLASGLRTATIGVDENALNPSTLAKLALALPDATFVNASAWSVQVRSRKLPLECALLERAARLAESGVSAAVEAATVGTTEREMAAMVSSIMSGGGGEPKFVSVTSGPRSAFADAFPTDRQLQPGDLVRFDIGCLVDGYWSDIGRTAVVGEPDALQAARYEAIFQGEEEELARIRPGMAAAEVFALAVEVVERHGVSPYRRQHCGHGIGLDVYEPPIINGSTETPLEEGMTFCLETPYYVLGWGGMMVEDTIVLTADGHTRFTVTDRQLREIPA